MWFREYHLKPCYAQGVKRSIQMHFFSGNALGTKQSQGVFERSKKNIELGASGDERFDPSSKLTEIQEFSFLSSLLTKQKFEQRWFLYMLSAQLWCLLYIVNKNKIGESISGSSDHELLVLPNSDWELKKVGENY